MPCRVLPASLRPPCRCGPRPRRPTRGLTCAGLPDTGSGPTASRRSYGCLDQCAMTARCSPGPRSNCPLWSFLHGGSGPSAARYADMRAHCGPSPGIVRKLARAPLCTPPNPAAGPAAVAPRSAAPAASSNAYSRGPSAVSPRYPDVSRLAGTDAIPARRGCQRPSMSMAIGIVRVLAIENVRVGKLPRGGSVATGAGQLAGCRRSSSRPGVRHPSRA